MHVPHVSAWPPQAISGLDLASFWRRAQVPVRSLRLAARAGSSRKVARGHASVSSSCPEPDCRETPALISSVNRQAQVRLLQLPRPSCHLRSPAGCRHCIRRAGGNFATSQSGSSRSGIDNKPAIYSTPPSDEKWCGATLGFCRRNQLALLRPAVYQFGTECGLWAGAARRR